MRENLIMYIGFLFVGFVVYLDYGKKVWGELSEDPKRLIWYGIGCVILIFGIIYKRMKSSNY